MRKKQAAIILALLVAFSAAIVGFATLNISPEQTDGKDAGYYVKTGKNFYNNDDFSTALVCYEKALGLEPANIQALHGKGLCENNLKHSSSALSAYEKLVAISPDNLDFQYEYVKTMLATKAFSKAKEYVESLPDSQKNDSLKSLQSQMTVKAPNVDVKPGTYDSYQVLHLTTDEESTWVYYTLDGTEPSEKSNYPKNGFIVVSEPETRIKAKCINSLGYSSETIELNYNVTVPVEIVVGTDGSKLENETYYPSNSHEPPIAHGIRKALGKNGIDVIYNYEAAQITELYVVGDNYVSDSFYISDNGYAERDAYQYMQDGVFFFFDGYESTSTNLTSKTRGNADTALLSYMPYLQTLAIAWQNNVSLKDISKLQYLENLSLLNNQITDIKSLADCTSLKKLSLGWNRIEDISALEGLTNLESLGLWNNRIRNLEPLSNLQKIRYLDISQNRVQSLDAIKDISNLEEFWANGNQISSLAPLDSRGNLRILMISNNPLEDFESWKSQHPAVERCDIITDE